MPLVCLLLTVEHNLARPYVYMHSTPGQTAIANYTHYNQSIAHPLGANFNELPGIGRYRLTPQIGLTLHVGKARIGYRKFSPGSFFQKLMRTP